jgi:class 3 adenylate cyclase
MSLRWKALLAVLAIVVAVTGGLVLHVSRLYEEAERRRIEADLEADARRLQDLLEAARQVTEAKLRPSLTGSAYIRLVRDVPEIKAGFSTYTRDWNEHVGTDVAVAALDDFVARDRKADILGRTKTLALCGFHSRASMGDTAREEILGSPGLQALLDASYAAGESRLAVVGCGPSVYYAVAAPFSEEIQEWVPIGVALLLVRLDDGWIARHLKRSGPNPVEVVVYTGTAVSGTSVARPEDARTALAASGTGSRFEVRIGDERYIGMRHEFDGPGILATKSLDRELAPLRRLQRSALLGGAGVAVGGVIAALAAVLLHLRRIERLRAATVKVREGDFTTRIEARGRDELAALTRDFNDMVTGLEALGLYTDPVLARRVLESGDHLHAEGRREEGSILFCDVADFTPIAEKLKPEELVAQLNELFRSLGRCVQTERGYLDKFIGDAVMAWWGPPFLAGGDGAARACRTALSAQTAVMELNRGWVAAGRPEFRLRFGIATGESIVGNLGSTTKKNFTVIGDPVNLASRLEGANKIYGTRILIDERTAALAGPDFLLREVDQIRVKGRQGAARLFELMATAAAGAPLRERVERYGQALASYRELRFGEAASLLEAAPADDGAAAWLRARCAQLAASPPAGAWEPVTKAESK